MRKGGLLAATLVSWISVSGVGLAAPSRCAMEGGGATYQVADGSVGTSDFSGPGKTKNEEAGSPPAGDIEQSPALKHVVGSGAAITEIGVEHGMRVVSAHKAGQFMILEVPPDGAAVVSGPQLALSVSTLKTIAGTQMTDMGVVHGMRALFLRNGEEFQVLYATPDEEATIAGVMWDEAGKNLTRSQTARIEGVTPSAAIGNVKDNPAALTFGAALEAVQNTVFGTIGDNNVPRLWVFIDPLCSYSVRALNELMPAVKQHRLQLAIIPLSLLDYETQNHSTAAALSLLSKAPDEMVKAWMARDYSASGSTEAEARLKTNMSVQHAIGVKGTPTFVWKKPDGSEGRLDGLPEDWKPVLASIEGAPHATDAK